MSKSVDVDAHNRYQNRGVKEFKTVDAIQLEDVPVLVADLRKVFATEKTMSLEWRKQQLHNFVRMIDECREEFCQALQKDLHKSPFEGYATELGLVKHEAEIALDNLDTWATPNKTGNSPLNIPCWSTTQRDPLGVILIMGAWNYPMQLSLAPMVGAIAGGNCVLLKPGSYAVNASNVLARVVPRYMDPECIRVVEGNRHVTSALLKERVDKIFFTGSDFVGRVVARAAAEHLTPCVLELGGKSPCVIDKTANIEHTVERMIWGTFCNGGQTCVRPDFVMVHEDVADKFFEECQKCILKFYGEDPQKTEWFGRLINDTAYTRLSKLVEENKEYVVTGGKTDATDKYICPTVFDFGSDITKFANTSVMKDELFGPLLPCVRYRDLEDVVQFIRHLPTGKPLALYAFSQDSSFIKTIKTRTTSGGLCVNDVMMHLANAELPFGGVGNSGMGAYHGKYSFDCCTHEKAVLEKSQMLDQSLLLKPLLAARFPPYTPFKQTLVKTFTMKVMDKVVNYPVPFFRQMFKLAVLYFVMRLLGFKIIRN